MNGQKQKPQTPEFGDDFYRMIETGLPPGRPLSKAERAEAKRRWELHLEERKRIKAEIARIEKEGGNAFAELGLFISQEFETPAWKFIRKRLKSLDDHALRQTIFELIVSDIPLDPKIRVRIGAVLHPICFPDPERDRREKKQAEIKFINSLKAHLQLQGMTVRESEEQIAKDLGISVDAVRKKLQRAR